MVVSLSAVLMVATVSPADAYQRPGRTERITVTPEGEPGTGPVEFTGRRGDSRVAITPDGRFVAFDTLLVDLVEGDENDAYDVFVRDTVTGVTERVSVTTEGAGADGHSYWPSISADGRYVAFESEASNLVPGDTNGMVDVFVHDRETGETRRASVGPSGEQATRDAVSPSMSADGRYISFSTNGAPFVPGDDNLCQEIVLKDLESGAVEHITVTPSGETSEGVCTYGITSDISADGRYVAFETQMHDLVEGDLNASWDIFVRDRQREATERVSVAGDESEANYVSYSPAISGDGRFISFYSCASNLVPEDHNSSGTKVTGFLGSNTCFDAFVRDRELGRTERVSVSSFGEEASHGATWTDITPDGRFVAFASHSTNLVPGAADYLERVYVHDRSTRQTELVSLGPDGGPLPAASWANAPAISADGRSVAFNTGTQVWRRDRGPATGIGEIGLSVEGDTVSASGWAGLAGEVLTRAEDPADDAVDPGADLGGDLRMASIVYRPEEKDLLVRMSVEALPSSSTSAVGSNYVIPGVAGAPGVVHTLRFSVNGRRWEVRAIRGNVEEPGYPPKPLIGLWRCDPTCRETLHMTGSYGSTGDEIIGSFTLQDIAASSGAQITDVHVTSALGDALTGGVSTLDQMQLPSASIPREQVDLGIAPAGVPEREVEFEVPALLGNGSFSGSLSTAALPPGNYELWARACVGTTCGASSTGFTR
ncbi:MAG TPA: hypothetical protein VM840_11265 [Actinomycetota bacterium]|nr:hypothetical protein [Actinomycetota bacterium]